MVQNIMLIYSKHCATLWEPLELKIGAQREEKECLAVVGSEIFS